MRPQRLAGGEAVRGDSQDPAGRAVLGLEPHANRAHRDLNRCGDGRVDQVRRGVRPRLATTEEAQPQHAVESAGGIRAEPADGGAPSGDLDVFGGVARVGRRREARAEQVHVFAAAVAAFGMLLRDSKYKGSGNFSLVHQLAKNALGQDAEGYRKEFIQLAENAKLLSGKKATAKTKE